MAERDLSTQAGYDVTAANYSQRPKNGLASLYITGTPDIVATPAMLKENPGCIRIDQSQAITELDTTADFYDVENGAITLQELPTVILEAIHNFNTGARPGQRYPATYCSRQGPFSVTNVCNTLSQAGIIGIGLIIADWNNDV